MDAKTDTNVGQCPVIHSGGRANRDWWPNQLNLQLLHQHFFLQSPVLQLGLPQLPLYKIYLLVLLAAELLVPELIPPAADNDTHQYHQQDDDDDDGGDGDDRDLQVLFGNGLAIHFP